MPRYFFNVHDGVVRTDDIGDELPDLMAARREAIRIAGRLLEDAGAKGDLFEEWRLEVVDESSRPLFHLDFKVSPVSDTAQRASGNAVSNRERPSDSAS